MPAERLPTRYRDEPEDVLREFWPLSVARRKVLDREKAVRADGYLPASDVWLTLLAAGAPVDGENTVLRLTCGDDLEGEPVESATQYGELQPAPWGPAWAVLTARFAMLRHRPEDAVEEFLREAVTRASLRGEVIAALKSSEHPDVEALLRLFDACMA